MWIHISGENVQLHSILTLKFTPRPLYLRERTAVPTELENGWVPAPVWTLKKTGTSLASAGIRTPDSPTRSLVILLTLPSRYAVAQFFEALCHKPEGRGYDSRWYHWNFSLT